MVAECRHPNIVRFYGIARSVCQRRIYLIMEWCPYTLGTVLADCKRYPEARLPLRRRQQFALHIAQSARFLHSRGVVHRDLKVGTVVTS